MRRSLWKLPERQKVKFMTTLAEIENAADKLSGMEKEQLLLFLAKRLRDERQNLPSPRRFGREQVDAWIAEDEADLQQLRSNT